MTIPSRQRAQRRHLLKIILGAGFVPTFVSFLSHKDTVERQLIMLASSLSNNHSIRRIGYAYISNHPRTGTYDYLLHDLKESTYAFRPPDTGPIQQSLELAIRHDFKQGQIEKINNWWFSRTETQLYALCTLLV